MRIVFATTNINKLRECREILKDFQLQILSLQDFPHHPPIIEDGETFAQNALKKARIIADFTGYITVADDSGLAVDFLGGMPGIMSARYAGEKTDDQKNNTKLLQELKGVPQKKRGASFKCAIAIVDPAGREKTMTGEYRGIILTQPRGNLGFGYDPIFLDPVSGLTFAEMDPAHKNRISHRFRALNELKKILPEFVKDLSGNMEGAVP